VAIEDKWELIGQHPEDWFTANERQDRFATLPFGGFPPPLDPVRYTLRRTPSESGNPLRGRRIPNIFTNHAVCAFMSATSLIMPVTSIASTITNG
jgi:hypothetical protein